MQELDIGDIVKVKETGNLGVITERNTFKSHLGNLCYQFSIEPFNKKGKWSWFFTEELKLIREGPIHKYRDIHQLPE